MVGVAFNVLGGKKTQPTNPYNCSRCIGLIRSKPAKVIIDRKKRK